MTDANYRPLVADDLDALAQVLAQAFENDPLVSYILPNGKTRVKTVAKFFRAMGSLYIRNKIAFGIGDPLQGVAVWNFPNQASLSTSLKDLMTFMPLLFSYYPIGAQRARAVFRQIDINHKRYAGEPHFYLDNLGVLPSAQGKGLSSKLIRPFLEMAEQQKVICYTDTLTPANVPLYQHFGFQLVREVKVENTGITCFALRRPIQGENHAY